ncbi:TPA: ABC-three component system protein [Streptococcus suis]
MAGKKNNATSSWSGYNHQGQIGIFLALKELNELLPKGEDLSKYSVAFEKEDGEDVDIMCNNKVLSRHQVKAKTSGKVPSAYRDVLINFKNKCVPENSMYLHTICKIDGFEEYKSKKKDEGLQIHNIKLYQYPDGNTYCGLSSVSESKIDIFCKSEIKRILIQRRHSLKDDDDHIDETLFVIKDLLCKKIREAHEAGKCSNPVILFSEIYAILISTEKREKQAIRRAKDRFERCWNSYVDGKSDIDRTILNNVLNISDKDFKQLLIDLHPHDDSIGDLTRSNNLDGLIHNPTLKRVMYSFIEECKKEKFNLDNLRYETSRESFKLSLINDSPSDVHETVANMRNNEGFLTDSFDTDYLINRDINDIYFHPKLPEDDRRKLGYTGDIKLSDSIFHHNMKFISIKNTLEKLAEDKT